MLLKTFGFWLMLTGSWIFAEDPSDSCVRKVASLPQSKLQVVGPQKQLFKVRFRHLTQQEFETLLRRDESGEPVDNIGRYWAEDPASRYFRWDLESEVEVGLINDLVSGAQQFVFSGESYTDEIFPRAAVIVIKGKEVVAGVSKHRGNPIFIVDHSLRKGGFREIGSALLADYLFQSYEAGVEPSLEAIGGSHGFYHHHGFRYSDPDIDPSLIKTTDRLNMWMPLGEVPAALEALIAKNQSAVARA